MNGLFNYLFGQKKEAQKLRSDKEHRVLLWQEHLSNYPRREALAGNFSPKNIDQTLQDWKNVDAILSEMETLISEEVVSIEEAEYTEEEIILDLKKFTSGDEKGRIHKLNRPVAYEIKKQKAILVLMKKIYQTLKLEIHAIKLIRKQRANSKELLLQLFTLVYHNEAFLYKTFRGEILDTSATDKIDQIVKAILMEEVFKEELATDEEKFIGLMLSVMANEESRHQFRKLGEKIFDELIEMARDQLSTTEDPESDLIKVLETAEGLMKDDKTMYEIVKKLRPKQSDEKINWIIKAFRKSFELGHFIEQESEFAT